MPPGVTEILPGLLNNPAARDLIWFVFALVLVGVIDRRLVGLIQSVERLLSEQRSLTAHQTSRMQEIRDAMTRIVTFMGRMARYLEHRVQGGQDGGSGDLP